MKDQNKGEWTRPVLEVIEMRETATKTGNTGENYTAGTGPCNASPRACS